MMIAGDWTIYLMYTSKMLAKFCIKEILVEETGHRIMLRDLKLSLLQVLVAF